MTTGTDRSSCSVMETSQVVRLSRGSATYRPHRLLLLCPWSILVLGGQELRGHVCLFELLGCVEQTGFCLAEVVEPHHRLRWKLQRRSGHSGSHVYYEGYGDYRAFIYNGISSFGSLAYLIAHEQCCWPKSGS